MADGDTVRELYEGCYRRLVGQLFAICGNLGEAEDAVQEAFVRAVEKPQRLAQLDNPEAWLRTVALNAVRRRYRRATRFHGLLSRAGVPETTTTGLSADRVALVATAPDGGGWSVPGTAASATSTGPTTAARPGGTSTLARGSGDSKGN
jgi:DNA-directed RNA polymerase specialized sigma24 family protein